MEGVYPFISRTKAYPPIWCRLQSLGPGLPSFSNRKQTLAAFVFSYVQHSVFKFFSIRMLRIKRANCVGKKINSHDSSFFLNHTYMYKSPFDVVTPMLAWLIEPAMP
jgi:hypothetical protein